MCVELYCKWLSRKGSVRVQSKINEINIKMPSPPFHFHQVGLRLKGGHLFPVAKHLGYMPFGFGNIWQGPTHSKTVCYWCHKLIINQQTDNSVGHSVCLNLLMCLGLPTKVSRWSLCWENLFSDLCVGTYKQTNKRDSPWVEVCLARTMENTCVVRRYITYQIFGYCQ